MSIEKIINYGIDPEEAKRIYNGLVSYRGYKDSFLEYPENFLKELMSDSHDSAQLYLPLEIIELTPFLVGGRVFGDFLLFDIKFIRKQFKAYPIYIELEIPKEKIIGKGAFYIEDTDLLKYCKSIFINSEPDHDIFAKKAINIINELSDFTTHSLIDIPAMTRKQASISDLSKYRIYIDDIHDSPDGEVVWAKDVRDALERVAKKYPEAEKIISMYYKNSPFINKPGFTIKKESSVQKMAQAVDLKLRTTPNQDKILEFIREALNSYGKNANGWAVGGYVRDSLMGLESDDLDIALSGVTGLEFAQYLKELGKRLPQDPTGKLYSTALDKTDTGSGDLQVAALDIFGEKIDFVNLRTETYTEDSRVPVQTITDNPAEDALRRDLTINALYYNIKDQKIEDYIGAMADFEKMPDGNFRPKILRTPSDPKRTFMDDPLRMLRALRFFSRYDGVELDPEMVNTFKDPEVLSMYDKLAPERASKEIRKMMQGPQAVDAARVLLDTGLYKKVFNVPEDWQDITMDQQNPYHNFNLMNHTLAVMENYNEIAKRKGVEGDERGLMLLATLLHDFGKMHPNIRKQKMDRKTNMPVQFDRDGQTVDRYTYLMHENASAEFAQHVMTQMGFSPEEKKFVSTIVAEHMVPANFDKSMKEKTMGKYLKETGDLYEHIMDHSEADALSKGNMSEEDIRNIVQKREENLHRLREYREKMKGLINRPVIDGNQISSIVNSVAPELVQNKAMLQIKGYDKPTFYLKILMDRLLQQQWSGKVTNPQEAERWVSGDAKQLFGLWKQQNNDRQASVKKLVKQAALKKVVSQHLGEENHSIMMEGKHRGVPEPGVQTLNRSISINFDVGDTVRMRNRGMNFKQKQGKVEKIKNNIMFIKWEDGKTTEYSLNDSARIFSELEKDV